MIKSPQFLLIIVLIISGIIMLSIHNNYSDDKKKQLLTAGIICTVIGIGWGGLYILFHGFGAR